MIRTASLLLAVLAGIAPTPSAGSADAVEAHAAIGRLNLAAYRKRQHCTAFLAGPGLVLTAAHCVDGRHPAELHLLLGYRRGEWDLHLRPAAIRRDADGGDVAALCVGGGASWFRPSRTPPRVGETLLVLGYGRPRMHALTATSCPVSAYDGGARLRLACPLTPGTSGAPVLRPIGDGHEVVGVISRSNRTSSLALRAPGLLDPGLCRNAGSLDGDTARRRSSR